MSRYFSASGVPLAPRAKPSDVPDLNISRTKTNRSLFDDMGHNSWRNMSSVRLACLNPDRRCFHALNTRDHTIDTYRLPLTGQDQESRENETMSGLPAAKVRTVLPENVVSDLELDNPLELICVEGETSMRKNSGERLVKFPKLCVYTHKSVYLLQIGYPADAHGGSADVVDGEVVLVEEPFENELLEFSLSNKIIRVRPAPQNSLGFAILSAPGSMAMLTNNKETNEYSLILHHGDDKHTTTPLIFKEEDVGEPGEAIVDFCFAKSRGLSLFSSTSVLMLKASGDLLSASPVLFRGSVVARNHLEEAHDYLTSELERLERSTAKWRQLRAAQAYFLDTFPIPDKRNQFVTARIDSSNPESVANWGLRLQGPILFKSEYEQSPPCLTLENFGDVSLVSIAIGKCCGFIDFAVISPSVLLPRFEFESINDACDLDGDAFKMTSLIERVSLELESPKPSSRKGFECLGLVPDPVVDTLLHVATTKQICTISTNTVRVASRRVFGERDAGQVVTNAWCTLNVVSSGCQSALRGTIISSDTMSSHEIIVRLEDGTVDTVNVSEAQYVHDMKSMFAGPTARNTGQLALTNAPANAADEALRNMQATKPLYEIAEPIFSQIAAGLGALAKIEGSATSYKDISPDALAVANKVKERCDREIVLPLLELKKAVESRKEKLKVMLKSQQKQVADLNATISDFKRRVETFSEMLQTAESNATKLSESCTRIHQASLDLQPTITEQEYEFFNQVKQLDKKSKKLQETVGTEQQELERLSQEEWVEGVSVEVAMPAETTQFANQLLDGNSALLKNTRYNLDRANMTLKKSNLLAEENLQDF